MIVLLANQALDLKRAENLSASFQGKLGTGAGILYFAFPQKMAGFLARILVPLLYQEGKLLPRLLNIARRQKSGYLVLLNLEEPSLPDATTVENAWQAFRDANADSLISLDEQGEETEAIRIFKTTYLLRNRLDYSRDRQKCFPLELPSGGSSQSCYYTEEQHRSLSEEYRDRGKDLLLYPEKVPHECKHLIPDDIKRVETILALPYGKKVLDVGCSDGTVTLKIAKGGCTVTGIDIAASAIGEAEEQRKACLPEIARKVNFQIGTVEGLPFPEGTFDTVCAFEFLEHVGRSQLHQAVSNLQRALKPQGNLLFSTPNRYPRESYTKEDRARWKYPSHLHFFSKLSLQHLLQQYFQTVRFVSMRENEPVEDSIYLIGEAKGKKNG